MTVENKILHHQLLQIFWVNNVKIPSWKQQILQSVDQKAFKNKEISDNINKNFSKKLTNII